MSTHQKDACLAPWAEHMSVSFATAVAITGGLGNLLAVIVLLQQTLIRRTARILKVTADSVLVLQLAVADLLYCTVSLPLSALTYLNKLPHSLCAFAGFFRILCANVEFNTLGLVALERSYHIYHGRRADSAFSVRKTRMYCFVLWVVGVMFQLPGISMEKYGFNRSTCRCDLLFKSARVRGVLVALEVMLPLLVLLASYNSILRRVRSSRSLLAAFSVNNADSDRHSRPAFLSRRYRSAGRSLLGLIVLYCVCILPMAVYNIIDGEGHYKDIGIIVNCIYWTQYAANTVIYVFTNTRFNRAFRIMITCDSESVRRRRADTGAAPRPGFIFSSSFRRNEYSSHL